jgi:hypothetical protein
MEKKQVSDTAAQAITRLMRMHRMGVPTCSRMRFQRTVVDPENPIVVIIASATMINAELWQSDGAKQGLQKDEYRL